MINKLNFSLALFILTTFMGSAPLLLADATPSAATLAQWTRALCARALNGMVPPPSDPLYHSVRGLITRGDIGAAVDLLLNQSAFLELTVPKIMMPLVTYFQSETLSDLTSDGIALMVGIVRDGLPFSALLTSSDLYVAPSGLTAPSAASATQLSNFMNVNQTQLLKNQIPYFLGWSKSLQAVPNPNVPAGNDCAGLFSTQFWGVQYYSMGTNRRAVLGTYQLLGLLTAQLRVSGVSPTYISQDVTRNPDPSNPALFQNLCETCHSVMDGERSAFAYYDYKNNALVYTPGVVANKYFVHKNVYPAGHVVTDNSWVIGFPSGTVNLLGLDPGALAGKGLKSYAQAYANSMAFYQAVIQRMIQVGCPNTNQDAAWAQSLAANFKKNQNFKAAFKSVLTQPKCYSVAM